MIPKIFFDPAPKEKEAKDLAEKEAKEKDAAVRGDIGAPKDKDAPKAEDPSPAAEALHACIWRLSEPFQS